MITSQKTWFTQSSNANCQLVSSYPVPFSRHNQDFRKVKQSLGYFNDSTHINPSDPNSMIDQGIVRNAVYNFSIDNIPNGRKECYSKALGKSDKGSINNTFYSFGAKYTNIRDHFSETKIKNPSFRSAKTLERASHLNKKFQDIMSQTMIKPKETVEREANVVMNDYTKNISQSIFNPGVMAKSKKMQGNQTYRERSRADTTTKKDKSDQVYYRT